jgi:hypothetical protein
MTPPEYDPAPDIARQLSPPSLHCEQSLAHSQLHPTSETEIDPVHDIRARGGVGTG